MFHAQKPNAHQREQRAPGAHAPPSEACAREGREGMPSPSTVRRHYIISDLEPDPTGLTSLRSGKTDHHITNVTSPLCGEGMVLYRSQCSRTKNEQM